MRRASSGGRAPRRARRRAPHRRGRKGRCRCRSACRGLALGISFESGGAVSAATAAPTASASCVPEPRPACAGSPPQCNMWAPRTPKLAARWAEIALARTHSAPVTRKIGRGAPRSASRVRGGSSARPRPPNGHCPGRSDRESRNAAAHLCLPTGFMLRHASRLLRADCEASCLVGSGLRDIAYRNAG